MATKLAQIPLSANSSSHLISTSLILTPHSFATTMAPPPANDSLKSVEGHLRAVIETLYEISVGVYGYQGPESTDVLANQISKLSTQYSTLTTSASKLPAEVAVPREVIQYIEDGRNPDIYTREFVEIVVKQNQFMKGKMEAYRDFRDVLAEQIKVSFPELKDKVEEVVEGTGGRGKVNGA